MEKYIYKVTNKINGKVYIGQTNNLKRRIQEHKHDRRAGHLLHAAIKKYGFENFEIEILYFGPEYNDKEREYISLYDSRNPKKGYNITTGGQDSHGEDNPMAVLTAQQAKSIQNDLMNSKKTFPQIAKSHGVDVYFVNHINYGESFANPNLTYPLRQSDRLSNETVDDIIKDLSNESMPIGDIVAKYHTKRYVVLNINSGKTYKKDNLQYPIRELFTKKEIRDKIIDMLRNTELDGKQIAKQLGVSLSIVYKINDGSSWHDNDIKYPIRRLKSVVGSNDSD